MFLGEGVAPPSEQKSPETLGACRREPATHWHISADTTEYLKTECTAKYAVPLSLYRGGQSLPVSPQSLAPWTTAVSTSCRDCMCNTCHRALDKSRHTHTHTYVINLVIHIYAVSHYCISIYFLLLPYLVQVEECPHIPSWATHALVNQYTLILLIVAFFLQHKAPI